MSVDLSRNRSLPLRRRTLAVGAVAAVSAVTLTAQPAEAAPAPGRSSMMAREVARRMIPDTTQFRCFNQLVERESGWKVTAVNAASGAYGLLQAVPGSKMASAGPDWRTNPATQISWGLAYMKNRYGGPCGAWSFWRANRWY
ncbi:transglycosylase SLT domain-containing protein [Streptomyces pactum]|nr:transglycosylase SLT domain-containing protein [Streptomyces pactum]